jgi:hypothetical protein
VHLLKAAVAVRWCRPDLTAALAEHLLDTVPVGGEQWLAAAGWRVHAHALLGDGRVAAAGAIDAMAARVEAGASSTAGALRLRVALAAVARGVGEPATARALLVPALDPAAAPDVRADAWCELARCVAREGGDEGAGVEGIDDGVGRGENGDGSGADGRGKGGGGGWGPQEVDAALRAARAAAAELGAAEAPVAAHVALTAAAVARCAGRAEAASDHAEGGLTVLQCATSVGARPAPLLAAALLAEQVAALREMEPGQRRAAADRAERLLGECGPNRCTVELRAALACAGEDDTVAKGLQRAADEAAEIDAPDLEAECRSRLALAWERAGRLDAALAALRLALDAARRDSDRSAQVRAALAVAAATWLRDAPQPVDPVPDPSAHAPERADGPCVGAGSGDSREGEPAGGGTRPRPRAADVAGGIADDALDGQQPASASPLGRHPLTVEVAGSAGGVVHDGQQPPAPASPVGPRPRTVEVTGGVADDVHAGQQPPRSASRVGPRPRAVEVTGGVVDDVHAGQEPPRPASPAGPRPRAVDVAGSVGDAAADEERPASASPVGPRPRAVEVAGSVADTSPDGEPPAPAPPAGRHEASGERPPFRPAPATAGDNGRRRCDRPAADSGGVDGEELGLADLLAEALDAFRKL